MFAATFGCSGKFIFLICKNLHLMHPVSPAAVMDARTIAAARGDAKNIGWSWQDKHFIVGIWKNQLFFTCSLL